MPSSERPQRNIVALTGTGNSEYSRRLHPVLEAELEARGFHLRKKGLYKERITDSTVFTSGTSGLIIGDKIPTPSSVFKNVTTVVVGKNQNDEYGISTATSALEKGAAAYITLGKNPQKTGEYIAYRMADIINKRRQKLIELHTAQLGNMFLNTLSRELVTPTGKFELRINEANMLYLLFNSEKSVVTLKDLEQFNDKKFTQGALYHWRNRLNTYLEGSGYSIASRYGEGYTLKTC